MGASATLKVLRESIEAICEIPIEQISELSTLAELDIDSLAVAEIIVEVEIRLACELPMQLLRRLDTLQTVGDVARVLESAVLDAASERSDEHS